jgi:hypothetical protein
MPRYRATTFVLTLILVVFSLSANAANREVGPLRVASFNPRYFTDGSGRAIYLTGSHHWDNLLDRGAEPKFDYTAYLDFLVRHNHNFIRLWTNETAGPGPNFPHRGSRPLPYQRTGPGTALDGNPKFDLTELEPAYFERLRSRVKEAGERGIYVMVMLFQGFSIHNKGGARLNPWPGHPFNAANNINGIDGDANRNGEGEEVHTLQLPAVTRIQEAYVRKVLDTLNEFDNVLYEVANESHRSSAQWQYHMIRLVREHEETKPKQHAVVMTFMWDGEGDDGNDDNAPLFASPAEAISPGRGLRAEYRDDPPVADGTKVIISDTDHLWGVGGDEDWVWKTFMRGLNPIFMDPIEDPKWNTVRRAMGRTLTVANRIDLARLVPRTDLASTGYCLADPGAEYLVYLPSNGADNFPSPLNSSVDVDLSESSALLRVTWFNPSTGQFRSGPNIRGRGVRNFTAPFSGPAVLHLAPGKRKS